MSDDDDEVTRGVKEFLLRMLSFLPGDRPDIVEVYRYIIQEHVKITGASTRKTISTSHSFRNFYWKKVNTRAELINMVT